MSERTREAHKKLRRDMEVSKMILIVEAYRDRLDFVHPPVRSEAFRLNAYSKAACDEILGRLKSSGDLPFSMSALDILEGYAEKMKLFAGEHKDEAHRFCFLQAADIAEYFIEQYWFNQLGED